MMHKKIILHRRSHCGHDHIYSELQTLLLKKVIEAINVIISWLKKYKSNTKRVKYHLHKINNIRLNVFGKTHPKNTANYPSMEN